MKRACQFAFVVLAREVPRRGAFFQRGLHLLRVGKIFLAHRCRRDVHHVAPTLLIFNRRDGVDDIAVPPDGVSGIQRVECWLTPQSAVDAIAQIPAALFRALRRTVHPPAHHQAADVTARTPSLQGWAPRAAAPDQAAYQRALSSPGMSGTRNIWWCCPPCTLQLRYDVPHAHGIVLRPDCH